MRPLKETVYVLYSLKDRHFYVGYTSNLELRLAEHEEGLVNCTARRRPFMLLHTETYLLKSEALRRENYFKSWQGKRALRLMLQESLLVLSRQ